jgi:hypothetical protein
MINLQTGHSAVVVGHDGWKDLIRGVRPERCVCCGDCLYLSDDEILGDFVLLAPQEAMVNSKVRKQVAETERATRSGERLALIRWKDDTESLVVFPAGDLAPSPEILIAAYWNGYSTEYVSSYLDELWETL